MPLSVQTYKFCIFWCVILLFFSSVQCALYAAIKQIIPYIYRFFLLLLRMFSVFPEDMYIFYLQHNKINGRTHFRQVRLVLSVAIFRSSSLSSHQHKYRAQHLPYYYMELFFSSRFIIIKIIIRCCCLLMLPTRCIFDVSINYASFFPSILMAWSC